MNTEQDILKRLLISKKAPTLSTQDVVELALVLIQKIKGVEKLIADGKIKGEKGQDARNPIPDVDYLSKSTMKAILDASIESSVEKNQKMVNAVIKDFEKQAKKKMSELRDGLDAEITPELIEEITNNVYRMIDLPDIEKLLGGKNIKKIIESEGLSMGAVEGLEARLNELLQNIKSIKLTGGSTGGNKFRLESHLDVDTKDRSATKAYLKWNDVKKVYEHVEVTGAGASAIADLTDVELTGLANGDVLIYNSVSEKWENETLAGGGDMLASVYDPANGARQVAFNDELFSGDYDDLTNKPTIPVISDTAYDATSWNSNLDGASKNAIRDKIETMDSAIALNTAKETNATHTGDVTGATALTIANNAVTNAKLADMAGHTVKVNNTASSGDPVDLVIANNSTILRQASGSIISLTASSNDVLRRAGADDLRFGQLVTNNLGNNMVTNGKLATMATKTYKGRTSAGTGDPEDVSVATLKADLTLVKADVGLGNVDNTSDANKPVSTAQQTALDLKENLSNKENTTIDTSTTKYPTVNLLNTGLNTRAIKTQTTGLSFTFLGETTNGDYMLYLKLPFGCTITETTTKSVSGTGTATFKINTTALGGTANSVSSTEQSQAHSSANVASAGDDLVVTISSASALTDMSISLTITRTLA